MTESSKAIFLSYASQDAEAAERICDALRAGGIEVWFDQSELRGGDVWDQHIRRQIKECALFIPVISAHTQARSEGYFRLEWHLADQRKLLMTKSRPFLVPVCIDATRESDAEVPDSFSAVQWTRLAAGETPTSFVERVSRLLMPEVARARADATIPGTAPSPVAVIPSAWVTKRWTLLIAVLAVIGLGYLGVRRFILAHRPDAGHSALPRDDRVAAPAPSRALDKSVAVLPFSNRSGDPAQDFYADGLTDELATALGHISALKVIASNSASRYKGSDKRPSEIAHDLGVSTLVTGSVLRANGRVRYTADLISADTERILWAESYERDERDVLKLQSEVARAIANAVAARISPVETQRLAGTQAVDPRAFDEYLLGRALWNQRTEPSVRQALAHFENATRIAPTFALGYAGIADSHIILGVNGYDPPRVAFPLAKAAALKAIGLDPGAGEPHASLGDILFHYDWDWVASEREHEKAIELAPAFATGYQWSAEALTLQGDLAGALARLQRARAVDPLSMTIRGSLANTLGWLGRREEAVAELRVAIKLNPSFPRTRRELALQLLALGRTEEALTEARELTKIVPDNLPAVAVLGLCLGRAGHVDEARALLAGLENKSNRHFVSSLELARIAAGLLDRRLTIQLLERAVAAREGYLPFIGGDDEFAFLHHDSRFLAIERKIGIGASRGVALSAE